MKLSDHRRFLFAMPQQKWNLTRNNGSFRLIP
jgi:hypothetical protein